MSEFKETLTGKDIDRCAEWLKGGSLVAIPTETVYGLAANALDESAVLKIYAVKNRPRFNPLILHISGMEELHNWVREIPETALKLAETFWPGPLTLLLPKSSLIPDLVTAGSDLVALRVPAHPLTLELLKTLNFPLAAPSANPSGYVSPTSAEHVYQHLKNRIPYILDGGPCEVGLESTIIGFNEEGKAIIHRHGGIEAEKIEKVTGVKLLLPNINADNPATPGQLKSHYATDSPLIIGNTSNKNENSFLIRFKELDPGYPLNRQRILSASGSLEEAARNLFAILRELDALSPDSIYVEKVPQVGLGIAINDRLERAQHILKNY
jgi:L-threonylcarbamoyladenylate synthase